MSEDANPIVKHEDDLAPIADDLVPIADVAVADPTADDDVDPATEEAVALFANDDVDEGVGTHHHEEAVHGEDIIQEDHHHHHHDDVNDLPIPEPAPVEAAHAQPHHPMEMEVGETQHHVVDEAQPIGMVKDPLAQHHVEVHQLGTDVVADQVALDAGEEAAAAAMEAAAAAEAAEAAIGNVLDDVGVPGAGVAHLEHHQIDYSHHHQAEDDEVALAAAAAAAAVQAADGMAVVVDQALLATAAAAAASQVAEVLAEQDNDVGIPTDYAPLPTDPHGTASIVALAAHQGAHGGGGNHGDLLHARREKDRKRYSAMTPEARAAYNAHRRELYHKQGEAARKRRRERERERYHSLEGDNKKGRNERRAKLERDRYNRLSKEELANRNSKRRDRAKTRKIQQKNVAPSVAVAAAMPVVAAGSLIPPPEVIKMEMMDSHHHGEVGIPTLPDPEMVVGAPLPEATVDVTDAAMADASALAAEVAEQVIAGTNLDGAMEAAAAVGASAHYQVMEGEDDEGPTVQI